MKKATLTTLVLFSSLTLTACQFGYIKSNYSDMSEKAEAAEAKDMPYAKAKIAFTVKTVTMTDGAKESEDQKETLIYTYDSETEAWTIGDRDANTDFDSTGLSMLNTKLSAMLASSAEDTESDTTYYYSVTGNFKIHTESEGDLFGVPAKTTGDLFYNKYGLINKYAMSAKVEVDAKNSLSLSANFSVSYS